MPTPHQKVTPVMFTLNQISIIDAIVQNGEYKGRSHAIREMIIPVLEAGLEAINQGKGYQATLTLQTSMKKYFGEKMDLIAENSKAYRDEQGQAMLDLDGVDKTELKLAS